MNENKLINQKIVIVGGGTAGWMAANLMVKHWGKLGVRITLVESTDIGVIGVGEGSTPQMKLFFDEIGVAESKWMPACNATFKNGIRFKNWSKKTGFSSYFHPFASKIDAFTAPVFVHNCKTRLSGQDIHAHPDRYYLAARLAKQQLAPLTPESFPFDIGYGYHFDSVLLGHFLRDLAIGQGVEHIQATVSDVSQHANGDIHALTLDSGQKLEADLFVDCSGFKALLIGKSLNVPFVSFKENLFNDSAVALPTQSETIDSETKSTAMKYGWAWDIPLTNRVGNGYVYSSDFCDKDKAETELREKLGLLDSDVEARHLTMRVGRMQEHWCKNVLAVGLSQGFIEPLEATALHFVLETINAFIRDYGGAGFKRTHQTQFNEKLNARFEGIRDYIVGHYRLNSRTDTEYWNANGNNNKLSDNLVQIINCWTSGGDLTKAIETKQIVSYYPPYSWQCMLAGYGVFPPQQSLRAVQKNDHRYDGDEVDEFIRRSALNFTPHSQVLAKL